MDLMVEFVQDYLDGELDRLSFDLDFNHNMLTYYPTRERDIVALADCFNYYVAEEGFDKADGLDDDEHKELIRKQFAEFMSAMQDGLL